MKLVLVEGQELEGCVLNEWRISEGENALIELISREDLIQSLCCCEVILLIRCVD